MTKIVFTLVTNGVGYYNGLALSNPGSFANQVTISVYSAQGLLTGETQDSTARWPAVALASSAPPSTAGQIRGSIHISATLPLVAHELFGTSDFLAAVPGLAVRQ